MLTDRAADGISAARRAGAAAAGDFMPVNRVWLRLNREGKRQQSQRAAKRQ